MSTPAEHGPVSDAAVTAGLDALAWAARCIEQAADRAGPTLRDAAALIASRPGRLIVTGLGKSGLVGAKLAATFASTGTVASFVHAADALHGDAGMVAADDVVLGISNSGTTAEVVAFCRLVADRGIPVIAMTGCRGVSPLAGLAAVALDAHVDRECDPDDLAPTASTSVCLALGDALAVVLMVATGFGPDDFARHHPGGALGARLDR